MSWQRVLDPALGDGWAAGAARCFAVRTPADAARLLRGLGGARWTPVRGLPAGVDEGVFLDLAPLAGVRTVDAVDGAVHVEAGATWAGVEARLGEQGLTLGPLMGLGDEMIAESLAAPWDRRPSPRFGWLRDGLLALRAALPSGVTRCAVAPRRATGPDLARVPVGAGQRAGLITDVHLRVWPAVETSGRAASFRGWNEARAAAMAAWAAGCRPVWWCLRRAGRKVALTAAVPAMELARFDAATGALPAEVEAPGAALVPARAVSGADLAAGLAGITRAEVWDLRPEGATVYAARGAELPVDDDWNALAERVFAALGGQR
ncbi:MAG: FAD-binding oxidoreductase [Myxococcales bacterium]|nr:FAD-binding oxidoreductase [Myxococcales bacterium]